MNKLLFFLFSILILASCKSNSKKIDFSKELQFASSQLNTTLEENNDPKKIPRTLEKDGKLKTVGAYNWTSGFFAGNLWYMYKLSGEEKWKNEATKWTETLDVIQYWTGNHDVGFMIYCSYGNAYRFNDRTDYSKVITTTAESLSQRFNPKTGVIKSWDRSQSWDGKTKWNYPVIIDNMMNLELLFEGSLLSGNKKYYDIAVTHANNTIQNHYRSDYSSYHVVNYDLETGKPSDKGTNQGFTDDSSWARGQAWGLYGFVVCYRYTKDEKYLEFAENIASYIINHPSLPEDSIPLWDYHAEDVSKTPDWKYKFNPDDYKKTPRDVSAAAITASALLELSTFSNKQDYKSSAEKILTSLSNSYLADTSKNNYFILDHSVGSIPHGVEIDVPLVYADYYYLEAISRYEDLK